MRSRQPRLVAARRIGNATAIAALVGFGAAGLQSGVVTAATRPLHTAHPSLDLPTPQPAPQPDANYKIFTIGSISIPRLKVRQPVVYGVGMRSFDRGVGWWPGTALPGQWGNSVLGGHRTEQRKPFRHLDRLRKGDRIIMTYRNMRYVYEVRETFIVDDADMHIIDQTPGHTITLFSCHPVGATDQRIVVTGQLVTSTKLGRR